MTCRRGDGVPADQLPGLDAIEGVGRYDGVYMGAFSASDSGAPFVDSMLGAIPQLEQALGAFSN